MKKISLCLIFYVSIMIQIDTFAMLAPEKSDLLSTITIENYKEISLISENIDIIMNGETAEVTIKFLFKNLTDNYVETSAMFLSTNFNENNNKFYVNGEKIDYSIESYSFNHSYIMNKSSSWKFSVTEYPYGNLDSDNKEIDLIEFEMKFNPREIYEMELSYTYSVGGYPTLENYSNSAWIE